MRTPLPSAAGADPVEAMAGVLLEALGALGSAGQPELASRLGGRAYAVLRRGHPGAAQRINVLMHGLARMTEPIKEQTMTTEPQLDVRTEAPARRHELIFDTYGQLDPGTGFVLVNDHDPKPLYYQFAAEHAGAFSWDYLEQGPAVWRVRIGRPVAAPAAGPA